MTTKGLPTARPVGLHAAMDIVVIARRHRRAILSVYDKTGLVEFGQALVARGVTLISTGGTAKALAEAGVPVRDVASVTGFPEILDGRVKTLHPAIHAGVLARRDAAEHEAALRKHGLDEIDLVVSNLYPFEATVARGGDWDECIENIDVGGPSLIRGAAKNHDFVTVVIDPSDYATVLAEMEAHAGATTLETRRRLAGLAFATTAAYDSQIAGWMARARGDTLPATLTIAGRRRQALRYGENPHQHAAFYVYPGIGQPGVGSARQVQGKELSYNNIGDTDAAFACVAEFDQPAAAIIKHANPCGVAVAGSQAEAFRKALAADPVSAYGGIVALNRTIDLATAEAIGSLFAEVVIAPDAEPGALDRLARKTQLRLLLTGSMPAAGVAGLAIRSVSGGFLAQDEDAPGATEMRCVTTRDPTEAELAELGFAWRVVKHVKSNAIVLAANGVTAGIGAGQTSRVDSARIAAQKASERAVTGLVGASDAYFPFADGLEILADAGITAIIQPGGSIRDAEVIAAANARNLAMVFTDKRHFKH